MPLAPVDDHGTQLFYEDSGAPPDCERYTTLVFIHGTGIHEAIFRPLLPFSSAASLRLVFVNRRDYPESTPLSDDDLKLVAPGSSQDDNALFVLARGLELAEFLAWFVHSEQIPQKCDFGDEGGLSIVAWSSGNIVPMALLGNLASVSETLRNTLEPYLRSYIHYDGPRWVLGYAISQHYTTSQPLKEHGLNDEEKFERFKRWVSAYHNHPNIASRSLSGLTQEVASEPTPTFDRIPVKEHASVTSRHALFHSEKLLRDIPLTVFARNRNHALFDYDLDHHDNLCLWPKVPVKMLQCEKSLWEMPSLLWEIQDAHRASLQARRPVRRMEFHMIMGSSHLAHWDEPQKTLEYLVKLA